MNIRVAIALSLLVVAGPLHAQPDEQADRDSPKEIGLVEASRSRLAQLDITVVGDDDVIRTLTEDDFTIKVNLTKIKDFSLDRVCGPPSAHRQDSPDTENTEDAEGASGQAARIPSATYLFYFEQPHLTLPGRQLALDMARDLIKQLVDGDSRAMIVSNAAELKIVEPLTSDPERLLSSLKELEKDVGQFDPYAAQEDNRIVEIIDELNEELNVVTAIARARRFQKEERWRADNNMRRLKVALGQLVDYPAPKAVVYFADTMRSNPGEHYLSFFGRAARSQDSTLVAMAGDSLTGRMPFDKVVNEAAAQGIRFYTIQGEGLSIESEPAMPNAYAMTQSQNVSSNARVRASDSRRAMQDLAAETGGYAFINAARASRIAERIRADGACLYLASFDPSEFKEDAPMRVVVKLKRDDVQLRVRGRMVFQSASARLTSRLLHAFTAPDSDNEPFDIRAGLIPTAYNDGQYSALLQFSVPGTPLQRSSWEIGASFVDRARVLRESSGRVDVAAPWVPIVLEEEITFEPGDYEIVAVAHERSSGLIASTEMDVSWPDPDGERVTIGPLALLQPYDGAFVRGEQRRSSGSIALSQIDSVRTGLATAVVGLICRGKRHASIYRIERSLIGASPIELGSLEFDLTEDRCAQFRDLLSSEVLQPGFFRYELRVMSGERLVAESAREFGAVAP